MRKGPRGLAVRALTYTTPAASTPRRRPAGGAPVRRSSPRTHRNPAPAYPARTKAPAPIARFPGSLRPNWPRAAPTPRRASPK